jgi:protein-disulfide isomerase
LRTCIKGLAVAALIALLFPLGAAAQGTSEPPRSMPMTGVLTPEQTQAIEKVIRNYLMRNPQVILDAVESLEQKRNDEARAAAKSTLAEKRNEVLNDPDSPVAGNPQGDVAIVEFFDYRCPYCKQMEPSLAQMLKDDPKLRIVYKELPILGPDSVVAAHAALAAHKQGKYEPFHNALMRTRGTLDEATVMKIAAEAGLDITRLKADMRDPAIDQIIAKNLQLARALTITGTPGFVIGNQLVPGAVDLPTLKTLVAEARK